VALERDHVVYAVTNLAEGIAEIEALTGVQATPGGQHQGIGTRNALMDFGNGSYLEIIGPDPEQPEPAGPRPFCIDQLSRGHLAAWAARTSDLDDVVAGARAAGYDPGDVRDMSRATPDGALLEWRLATLVERQLVEIVPFLIDWGTTPHPTKSCAKGCQLLSLRAVHPDVDLISRQLAAVGATIDVEQGAAAELIAELDTPNGRVTLR